MIIINDAFQSLKHDMVFNRWEWGFLDKFKTTSNSSFLSAIWKPVFSNDLDSVYSLYSANKKERNVLICDLFTSFQFSLLLLFLKTYLTQPKRFPRWIGCTSSVITTDLPITPQRPDKGRFMSVKNRLVWGMLDFDPATVNRCCLVLTSPISHLKGLDGPQSE